MDDSELDTKKLFELGYYVIHCEECNTFLGFIRVDIFDYVVDDALCGDCAKALVERHKTDEENIYR